MKLTFDTTLERGDDELELRVTYELNPYIPATHLQPAEGGDCEILSAEFGCHDAPNLPAPLSEAEYETLQMEAEERAQQDAEDAAADHGDYLYQQYKDRRMMAQWERELS
jgi:uncharacterized protein (DUF2336 family)